MMNDLDKRTKPLMASWHRRLGSQAARWGILLAYLLALSFLSLNPWVRPASRAGVLSPDKIDHAIAYGGLAIIFYFCLFQAPRRSERSEAQQWLLPVGGAVLIGILLEICQSLFTSNRTGSVEDAVANAVGAVAGYGVFRIIRYLRLRSNT